MDDFQDYYRDEKCTWVYKSDHYKVKYLGDRSPHFKVPFHIVRILRLRPKRNQWMTFQITAKLKNAPIGPKIRSFWRKYLGDRSFQ